MFVGFPLLIVIFIGCTVYKKVYSDTDDQINLEIMLEELE